MISCSSDLAPNFHPVLSQGFSHLSAAEFRAQHALQDEKFLAKLFDPFSEQIRQDLRNFCNAFNKPLLAGKECIAQVPQLLAEVVKLVFLQSRSVERKTITQQPQSAGFASKTKHHQFSIKKMKPRNPNADTYVEE